MLDANLVREVASTFHLSELSLWLSGWAREPPRLVAKWDWLAGVGRGTLRPIHLADFHSHSVSFVLVADSNLSLILMCDLKLEFQCSNSYKLCYLWYRKSFKVTKRSVEPSGSHCRLPQSIEASQRLHLARKLAFRKAWESRPFGQHTHTQTNTLRLAFRRTSSQSRPLNLMSQSCCHYYFLPKTSQSETLPPDPTCITSRSNVR